jgi:hypothetical protein
MLENCIGIGAWNTYMVSGAGRFEGDEGLQWRVCALVSRDKTNTKIDCWRHSKDCWWLMKGVNKSVVMYLFDAKKCAYIFIMQLFHAFPKV